MPEYPRLLYKAGDVYLHVYSDEELADAETKGWSKTPVPDPPPESVKAKPTHHAKK